MTQFIMDCLYKWSRMAWMASRALGLGISEVGPHFLGGPGGRLADLLLSSPYSLWLPVLVTLGARQKVSECPSL